MRLFRVLIMTPLAALLIFDAIPAAPAVAAEQPTINCIIVRLTVPPYTSVTVCPPVTG